MSSPKLKAAAREWAEWLLACKHTLTADEELGCWFVLGLLGDSASARAALEAVAEGADAA